MDNKRSRKDLLLIFCFILSLKQQASGTLLSSPHQGPWRMVFKAPQGTTHSSYSSINDFYQASGSYNDGSVSVIRDLSAGSSLYKSSILDDWGTTRFITAVRWSYYKSGVEQKYIVFNAIGKTKTSYLDCSSTGIIESSYTDITSETKNYCTFDSGGRNFFINRNYGGCTVDAGWVTLKDYSSTGGCTEWDPDSNMPYIKYSTATTYQTWASGSVATADSFVISVLEWFMVFKGVPGVTPSDGSLVALYQSSDALDEDQSSYKTITTSPSKVYKSGIFKSWTTPIIDMVNYAFFDNAEAKCWFLFNGRDSTTTSWFTNSKILDSSYTDYTDSKDVIGVTGDTYRKFAIIDIISSCSKIEAWMMVLDITASTECSFDSAATKPYFIYSASTTARTPESGGSWDSANFPAADAMGIFIKGFFPVLKHAKSQSVSSASGLYDLWTGTYTLNEWDTDSFSKLAGSQSYKSSLVDSWNTYYIHAVRMSFFVGGVEKAYIVFDGLGSDKNSWLSCDRLLYSSYSDLTRSATRNFCSVSGDSSIKRYFFIESYYASCSGDSGWVGVMERAGGCSYEYQITKPYAIFADQSTKTINQNHEIADVFMISIAMDSYCGSSPCQNGAQCHERGAMFGCTCATNYYGLVCQSRDGGFTDWTAWGSCSVTCTTGQKTRSRSCTNPTVVGDGVDCSGATTDSTSCTEVAICPVDGVWSVWTAWGSCNVTCDYGVQFRTRSCNNPAPAGTGLDCVGDTQDDQSCYPVICPVDGGWADWSTWGSCSVSCDWGTKDRSRTCTNPAVVGAGLDCVGSSTDQTNCYLEICPVDGGWTAWTTWDSCSVTCDYGIQNRTRTCTNPTPVGRGLNCTGEPDESQSCYLEICPVDGMWGAWSTWADCSVTCESGVNTRSRNCDNPAKVGRGLDCVGDSGDSRPCFVSEVCPVYTTADLNENYELSISCPSNWSYYIYIVEGYYGNPSYSSLGSALCQHGSAKSLISGWCHSKTECTFSYSNTQFGSDPCQYSTVSYYKGYQQRTQQQAYWDNFQLKYRTSYYQVSVQHSTTHYHTRTKYGYLKYHCARDGQWNSWSEWTWCTKTCDTGSKTRNRTCNNPLMYSPGADCVGDNTETIDCYTQLCPICGDHWSTYGDPADIDTFNDTSTGVMFMMADINWDIHCCEVLSGFEFLPMAPGDIYFQIWRKKGSGSYELVGETMVSINSTQVGVVYNHTLALKSRINVKIKDEVGWYCSGVNMIPYTNCSTDVQLCPFENKRVNQSTKLNVGALFDWDNDPKVETLEGRGYAFKFYTHPNTAPYTNQSSYETLVKDHSPIGTSAIEYSIQDDDIGDVVTSSFSHSLFELNETFEWDIHIQTKSLLPKNYNVYQCILVSQDTCDHTTTTTIQITTYNAPPYYLNLPDKIEMKEDVVTRTKLITMDVIDRSENDSICCTLARVEPASLNFEIIFENNLYHLYTISSPVFNYKEISNYYKLRVCCSDTYGTSMSFLEIDIVDVVIPTAYVPPTWFLTAVAISMVPISLTFIFACSMLCITMFCDAEIRYIIIYE